MNRFIRRHSMERLELYDLDQFESNQPPPPPRLPPPRKPLVRRSSMNPSVERYQFLCNMARHKTDPIYAATPMFTTIPEISQEKPHRQLLGSYIRLENVKPIPSIIPKPPPPPGPKKVEIIEDVKEENGKENETTEDVDNDDNELSNSNSSSSSSSDEEKNADGGGGGGGDDDKDDKGIVEQIFNREKKT